MACPHGWTQRPVCSREYTRLVLWQHLGNAGYPLRVGSTLKHNTTEKSAFAKYSIDTIPLSGLNRHIGELLPAEVLNSKNQKRGKKRGFSWPPTGTRYFCRREGKVDKGRSASPALGGHEGRLQTLLSSWASSKKVPSFLSFYSFYSHIHASLHY